MDKTNSGKFSVLPLRGEPEGHEDPSCTLPAKSPKFQASSNPYLQTPIPFNDPTSNCVKIKECSGSPAKTSNPAASSTTGIAVSNFIRFSRIPLNTHGPLAFPTASCSGISFSTPLSFDTTHSTPKGNSALEKVGRIGIITQNTNQDSVCPLHISPIETTSQVTNSLCSISLSSILTDSPSLSMVEVGSTESIQRDTNCSSRENSQNSSDLMYSVPPNTPLENENALETSRFPVERQCSSRLQIDASPSENGQNSPDSVYPVPPNTPLSPLSISEESLISSKENSDSDNGTRKIKSSVNLNSGCHNFKVNSTYPKSASKENGQNGTRLKNENSSKISILQVKRHCSSQLQIDSPTPNLSTSPLRESKHNKKATGCINRLVLYPDHQNQSTKNKSLKNLNSSRLPFKGNSTYPKSASEENRQNSTRLKNENSKISILSVQRHCSSQLQTVASSSNTSKCPLRESKRIENATECTNRFALHPDDRNQSSKSKYFKNRYSGCHRFKGNSTYPKSASEENGQNATRLKNENSSKISILPVKRHRSSQLQTVASPSNTSKCPLRVSKRIENATGCTNRLASNHEDQNQSTKNIKSFKNLNSGCHHFKGNSTYPKSASEENGQTNTPLKNGNSSKTSLYPVKRHCSSQLQTDTSPSNTSKCPLHGSKHTENATGCINRLVLYPDELYPGLEVRPLGNSKAANAFFEDKGRNKYMMSRYSESYTGESLATSNPIKSQPSSDERNIIENVVESLRQSYISLSMRNDLPTGASEMPVSSNKPDAKQSDHSRNETRKKSKLNSCLAACFRSSSPRQERQI